MEEKINILYAEDNTTAAMIYTEILEEAGYTFDNVVKSTCLLGDMSYFADMNEIYAKYYKTDCPARAAFAVKALPMGAMVEIETIAVK